METVGLFGDSFCQDSELAYYAYKEIFELDINDSKLERFRKFYNNGHPRYWNMLKGYTATANGVGGSDVYSAFLNFCANHYKFNRVVFFVTNKGRQSIWAQNPKKEQYLNTQDISQPLNWVHQPGLSFDRSLDYSAKKYPRNKNISILYNIAKSLYEVQQTALVADEIREGLFVNLMIEKLKQIRPDVCIIDCFKQDQQTIADNFVPYPEPKSTMIDIFNLELDKWNQKPTRWGSNLKDLRENHMTRESHVIFAEILQTALDNYVTHVQFDIEKFQNIDPDQALYFVKSNPKSFANYLKKLGWVEKLA